MTARACIPCLALALAACGHASSARPIDNRVAPFTIPALVAGMFEPDARWKFRVVTSTHDYTTHQRTDSPPTDGGCEVVEVRRFERSAASRIECHDLGGAEWLVAKAWLVDERGLWQLASDVLPDADPGRGDEVAWVELPIPPAERDDSEIVNEGAMGTRVHQDDDGAWCWGTSTSGMGSEDSQEICVDQGAIRRGTSYTGGNDTEVTVTFTRE